MTKDDYLAKTTDSFYSGLVLEKLREQMALSDGIDEEKRNIPPQLIHTTFPKYLSPPKL